MAKMSSDERRNKLQGLAGTLAKTDRILSGKSTLSVQFTPPPINAPSATDGTRIWIDPNKIEIESASGLVNVLGLNYHELCHVLFSPGKNDLTRKTVVSRGWHHAWNILEDMRIESLFAAMYGRSAKFFTAPVITYLVNKDDPKERDQVWSVAHLMTYGRKFLPREIRKEFRKQFRGTTEQRKRAERIIDAFRNKSYARPDRVDQAILTLVEDFHNLIKELMGDNNGVPLRDHAECASSQKQGDPDKASQQEAGRRLRAADAEDDAKEDSEDGEGTAGPDSEGSGATGSDGSGDVDSEDEEGEHEASGAADDGGADDEDSDESDDGSGGGDGDAQDDGAPVEGGPDDHQSENNSSDQNGAAGRATNTPSDSGDSDAQGQSGGITTDNRTPEEIREDLAESLEEVLSSVLESEDVTQEIQTMRAGMDDVSHVDFDGARQQGDLIPVTAAHVSASGRVELELQRLQEQFEPGWTRGTDHGVLNVGRVMQGEYDPDTMYDLWEEGNEEDAGLEVVILLDRSISMKQDMVNPHLSPAENRNAPALIEGACVALWVLKRAFDRTDTVSSVLGFGNHMSKLYGRQDTVQPGHWELFTAPEGGTYPRNELKEAGRILGASDKPNRLLVLITDGRISNGFDENDSCSVALSGVDATRLLVNIGSVQAQTPEIVEQCDVSCTVYSADHLVDAVRETVTSLMLRKIRS